VIGVEESLVVSLALVTDGGELLSKERRNGFIYYMLIVLAVD
jgi:hypothetical protein